MNRDKRQIFYLLGIFSVTVFLSKNILLGFLILIPHAIWVFSDKSKCFPTVGILVLVFDFIFFLRFVAILSNNRTNLGQIELNLIQIQDAMILITICFSSILFIVNIFQPKIEVMQTREKISDWISGDDSKPYLYFLSATNLISIFGILFSSGGLSQSRQIFFSHQKLVTSETQFLQFSLTLMSFFFIPLIVLLTLKGLKLKSQFYLFNSLILLGFNLYLFGGRLTLFLVAIITYGFTKVLKISIPWISYFLFGLFSIISSLAVIAARTSVEFASLTARLLESTSYPVLDAFTILNSNDSDLRVSAYSKDRINAYLISFIPRFVWPNKPTLTTHTLDSTISNLFGYSQNYGKTGWPSGFLLDASLFDSLWIYILFIITFAIMIVFIERLLIRQVTQKPGFFFINYYIFCNLTVTFLKDGDIFTSVQLYLRLTIWLNISFILTNKILRFLRRMAV